MIGQYAAWFDGTTVTGNDRELLRAICEHASSDFGMCVASQRRLAWDIGGVRRQTVNAGVHRLIQDGYVERIGETANDTLMLRPCIERPPDRDLTPPDPCPQTGQPLFPTNPDGSAILTPVRKADMSEKRTLINELTQQQEKPVGEGEKEDQQTTTNPTTTRARKNLSAQDVEAEFGLNFWPAYPRKVSKGAALRAFKTARGKATLDEILAGLGRSIAHWTQTGKIKDSKATQFVPHASTWLNGECWADELDLAGDGPGLESVGGSTAEGQSKGEKWSGGAS